MLEANTPNSRVIEIGAVRFDRNGVREQWSTLVNPGVRLPYAIRDLTGLDDPTLRAAPTLIEVAAPLRDFVGDDAIVGQSIDLDFHHLAQQGIHLANPFLDTFELATLLLPGLPTYDLASVAEALGLAADRPHRALPDAHLARQVFLALVNRIESLPVDVLMHVNRLTAALAWPYRELFQAAEQRRRPGLIPEAIAGTGPEGLGFGLSRVLAPPEERPEPLVPLSGVRRLDRDELARALGAGGSVARLLSGYEQRAEQLAMLAAVADAFNRGRHLIVEAGTGTGKSLAYLLPALAFAAANHCRVVVSTNTINLQDQLYKKDVPDLVLAMDYRVRTTVLKGRSNYLCLRRWLNLLRSEALSPEEITLLVKTLLWIGGTGTGDRSELRLTQEEEAAWSRICSQSESCSPLTCPYHREGSCFIVRARRLAEASHLVIVNHALLLSDLVARSRVIPDYEHLVIDEAHHLEDEATRQLAYQVSLRSFAQPLEAIAGAAGWGAAAAVALLTAGGVGERRAEHLREGAASVRQRTPAALARLGEAFDAVGELARARALPGETGPEVRLTQTVRHDGLWMAAEQRWQEARLQLEAIRNDLGPIIEELADAAEAGSEPIGEVLADLLPAVRLLETAIDQTDAIIAKPSPEAVCWATEEGSVTALHLAPLEVASRVRAWLLDPKATVVLTSATLSTEGSFDYIRERLGAIDAHELALGAPFDFERAAMLFLPTDMPEPAQPGYSRRASEAIADVAEALGGRTLALFTSHAQLRATYEMIRERMDGSRVVLMAQGIDGARTRLLQRFKTTDRALLLGTASFWEGVDVVGEALSALVIARLPFAVPTDPVFAARSEAFDEPFRQYAVPQAILRFKQGFGRLIRSRSDRGIVVVLDRRILSKFYGAAFLNSLPPCTLRTGPIATVGPIAREWLGSAFERL